MALNLNPALIANAIPYTNNLSRITLNTCNPQPQQGLAGVQIQCSYANAPGVKIDMASGGSANPPLAQCCAIWIDNSNSTHDVNIVIPDSGQTIRCAFGAQKLAPILSSLKNPLFYVMLDDNGNKNATDSTNLIVLNQYIPEFTSEDFSNALSYGYGAGFELQPAFTQSNALLSTALTTAEIDAGVLLFTATQYYINGIDIQGNFYTNDGASHGFGFDIQGASSIIYTGLFTAGTAISTSNITNINNLNLNSKLSGGNLNLFSKVDLSDNSLYAWSVLLGKMSINIYGGILIP